jgi:hypothetical protein
MEKHRPLSLVELNQILPRLEATIELLTGGVPGQTRRSQVRTVASRVAAQRKPGSTGASELRLKIREYLAKAGGGTVPQIAKALRADGEAVRYGLHVLRDEKVVRVTGTRMKATWSLAG